MSSSDSGDESDRESESTSPSAKIQIPIRRPSIIATSLRTQHYGSFYLRMGAVGKILILAGLAFEDSHSLKAS